MSPFRFQTFIVLVGILIASGIAVRAHALSGAKTKAAEEAGSVLFRDRGCAHCHGEGGAGKPKAPALNALHKSKLWTPAKITDQILNGGQKMPPFRESLTDDEVAQLVAYLRAKHMPVPPPLPAPSPAPAPPSPPAN